MNEALAILCGVWFLATLALGYLVYLQRQEMDRAAWRWENSGHILSIFRPFGKYEQQDYDDHCASLPASFGRRKNA